MSEQYLFTSESVTEGHPDKVADAIGLHFWTPSSPRINIAASLVKHSSPRAVIYRRGNLHRLLCGYAGCRPKHD